MIRISRIPCGALLLCLWASTASGQELHLDDVPSTGLSPDRMSNLLLSAADQAALQDAVKSRDYSRAETILAKGIERHPQTPELLTALGRILFLDGKYLNCAIALKKAEAVSPLGERDRFTLALSYIIMKHPDWARPELEKLAGQNPRSPLYPYWLGRLDYDAMQYQAAVAQLRKALDLDPTFMKAYDNLGLSYEGLGEYDEAIGVYQQAVTLNRQQPHPSPWPPLNLGTLLVKLGRASQAESSLQESLRYDPKFPKAHYQLGLLLEKQNKGDAAIHELTLATENDPNYPEPYFALGRMYDRRGEKAKAQAALAAFRKLKKESGSAAPQ
jgi:tetratricopeptide (TPR) repeat protein